MDFTMSAPIVTNSEDVATRYCKWKKGIARPTTPLLAVPKSAKGLLDMTREKAVSSESCLVRQSYWTGLTRKLG
jgi:hypothetical protein